MCEIKENSDGTSIPAYCFLNKNDIEILQELCND
jgi:hypothetical protein